MEIIRQGGSFVVDALFPRFCFGCKKEGSLWCEMCDETWKPVPLEPACIFCGETGSLRTCASCRAHTYLDGVSVYLPYGNPILRQMIGVWKYHGDDSVEHILKTWMVRAQDRLRPPMPMETVAAVPIHVSRFRSRGFDQADHLAAWVGELYGIAAKPILERVIKTKPQAKTIHTDRCLGEMDGVFALHPSVKNIPESVLLCDDVFTSGATMDAAAKCLKESGVKMVWGFVLAKGDAGR